MRIGIDFDNTIVCYDAAFHSLAAERELVPAGLAQTKESVRDHLRVSGREHEWTELQGYVYGPGMDFAEPFPGVLGFLGRCETEGVDVTIISHKTLHPYRGEPHDLHTSARRFLDHHRITVPAHFELTKEEKLARIGSSRCTHFIDDLPEFLTVSGFPPGVERVLFDPNDSEACRRAAEENGLLRIRSWREAADVLLAED